MPEGGTLTFVSENAVIEPEHTGPNPQYTMKPGDYALIRVCDTGVGMDEDTQRKIFEPFFTTKDQGKGTGLGLATADGIVKQSGGYIQLRTAPRSGAEFLNYLPRTDVAPDKVVAPNERSDGRPRARFFRRSLARTGSGFFCRIRSMANTSSFHESELSRSRSLC